MRGGGGDEGSRVAAQADIGGEQGKLRGTGVGMGGAEQLFDSAAGCPGEELLAGVGLALRPDDAVALHYRCAAHDRSVSPLSTRNA